MFKNLETRIIGIILMASGILYIKWLASSLNMEVPFFAYTFFIMALLTVISSFLLVINNWSWTVPTLKSLRKDKPLPHVGIIIPTWKEDPEIVRNTLLSIIDQNYDIKNLLIIVSDDSANPLMQSMTSSVSFQFPQANIVYHIPYSKTDPKRKGEGKAGNLNSALELIMNEQSIKYVETRDADDIVGNVDFLNVVLGELERDPDLAYVQTIKDVQTSKGDPFSNKEALFYRSLMLSKNAANAVFPCGSGLIWRKEALLDIGGFPDWNLVEDFQSGAEALRRGWKASYIPITGAIGQIAPEDIPNMYKQRGTWAMDSLRFLFYGDKKGLSLRQKLHFYESGLFYIASGMFFLQALIPAVILLLDIHPVAGNPLGYAIYLSSHISALYLFILSLTRNQNIQLNDVIKSLQTSFSLGPIYLAAIIKTLFYGKNRKPNYIVTRKYNLNGLYLFKVKEVVLISLLLAFSLWNAFSNNSSLNSFDWGTSLWALFYIFMFSKIIKNSFFSWRPFEWVSPFINRRYEDLSAK